MRNISKNVVIDSLAHNQIIQKISLKSAGGANSLFHFSTTEEY